MHNGVKRCWGEAVGVMKGGRGEPVWMKRSPLSGCCRPVRRSLNSHQFILHNHHTTSQITQPLPTFDNGEPLAHWGRRVHLPGEGWRGGARAADRSALLGTTRDDMTP